MNTYVFKIEALTNLHVGSGDAGGYGVVDKTVQRDATDDLPTIHASSLKGALREHYSNKSWVRDVFGSDPNERDDTQLKRGDYRFFSADLLALPSPHNEPPFYQLYTSTGRWEELKTLYTALGATDIKKPARIEEDTEKLKNSSAELPVIARNQLENGISQNLWYEEVVPRKSIFVTCIQALDETQLIAELKKKPIIQIGANATVGYGYCRITHLNPTSNAK